MSDVEVALLSSLKPVIEGAPPMTCGYKDESHLHELLRVAQAELLGSYASEEIVITTFLPEIYKHARQSSSFGADRLPEDLRQHYHFIYTLKGQEYKAGILVLYPTRPAVRHHRTSGIEAS